MYRGREKEREGVSESERRGAQMKRNREKGMDEERD